MILSDRTLREELAAGRIVIDPFDADCIQPSSIDLHVDHLFRVFRNDTTPYIDPKEPQEDLTELVEVGDGKAFILHPGEFVLGSTLERVELPDDLVARLEGKALAVDTEVPTPSGWTTMGELEPGDRVFDERGEPTRVVAATGTMYDRPCREVVFSDGSSVIADLAHLWSTVDKNGRRFGRRVASVRSTEVIAQTLRVRGERNHQIPLAAPVEYRPRDLPIHPYVLGVWLGDPTSSKPEITAAGRLTRSPSFRGRSRSRGLLGNGHIPTDYLQASVEQRTALLQGLMDRGGNVDAHGRCDFTSVRFELAEQVGELVASLGFAATSAKRRAMLDGIDCGPKYEVRFTPDRPVFRRPRKLERQERERRFPRSRAIADVRVVPPVPVRCIEVESARGLFLVTRSYIATHNSSLGRLGLLIHSTAGFVDAGFEGHLTLELSNVANLPIAIYPGMKIGQISFLRMTTPADVPYGSDAKGSKYQGQRGPTASRSYLNFRDGGE